MNAKIAALALVAIGSVTAVGNFLTRPEYKTVAAATYYVDPTGNNSNACTASGTAACATLSGVFAKLPPRILHAITINVAAGTYSDAPNLNGNEVLGNLTIAGPALVNVTPTTGSASGTLTAVNNAAPAVMTDSGATWTVNDFVGRHLLIGGVRRVIASNTATTITLASPYGSAPSVGAAYSIQKQGATFTANTTDATFTLRLSGNGVPAGGLIFISVSGLEFINTTGSAGDGCSIALSTQFLSFSNSRCFGLTTGLTYAGGGTISTGASTFHGTTGFAYGTAIGNPLSGAITASNGFFYGTTYGGLTASGTGLFGLNGSSGWTAQTNSSSSLYGAFSVSAVTSRTGTGTGITVFKCLQAGPAGAIQVATTTNNTSPQAFWTLDNLFIDGCTTGVDFSQGMGNATATATSSFTCRGTPTCISVANGSRFRVPGTFTLTGVTTDISIDGVAYTKANLTGASPTRLPTTPNITGSSVWQ